MIHRISSLVGLIVFWLLLLGRSPLYAADLQNSSGSPADSVVLFQFLPEKEMFYFSYDGNIKFEWHYGQTYIRPEGEEGIQEYSQEIPIQQAGMIMPLD